MNVRLVGSAAGVGVAGVAVAVFALVGGSDAKQAPKVQSPVAQTVSSPAPTTSAAASSAVPVVVKPVVKRQVVVSSSVQVQSAPAPVRRVAAVTQPTVDPTTPDAPVSVTDPATQAGGGAPLPTLAPVIMPPSRPVAVPSMPKGPGSPGGPTPTS
jgi:hypothetical protein